MKICTYCKSEIEDSCLQCPNCGASEFEHKCPVCGCSHKGGACPECTIQTASEVVGSVAVLTGRMKDMLSKVETNGGVENSKAENSKSENGEADHGNERERPCNDWRHPAIQPPAIYPPAINPRSSNPRSSTPSHPIPTHPVYGQNPRRYPCLPESSGIFFLAYFFICWPLS